MWCFNSLWVLLTIMALAAKPTEHKCEEIFQGEKKHSHMATNEVKITIRLSNNNLGRCWVWDLRETLEWLPWLCQVPKGQKNCPSCWFASKRQHSGLGWIMPKSCFQHPDETENRPLEWNNSTLHDVEIKLWKLGYGLISGIPGPTQRCGLDEMNVWFFYPKRYSCNSKHDFIIQAEIIKPCFHQAVWFSPVTLHIRTVAFVFPLSNLWTVL